MATVLWFYTQKQLDTSKGLSTLEMHEKELFASRHLDTVNVDCIESLAFVLTVNEFCRFLYFFESLSHLLFVIQSVVRH